MTFINDPGYLPNTIFIPSTLTITAITRSNPMQVSFTVSSTEVDTFISGQVVKLNIPKTYGMSQANGLTGKILTVGINTMTLGIDSTQFDSFAIPADGLPTPATLTPFGSQNLEFSNLTNKVPFQPLNNNGN